MKRKEKKRFFYKYALDHYFFCLKLKIFYYDSYELSFSTYLISYFLFDYLLLSFYLIIFSLPRTVDL